jgi:competence protein ComGC
MMMNARQPLKYDQGFSLMEMAVVLMVTAAMSVALVPSVVEQAQYDVADSHVDTVLTMHHALKTYYNLQVDAGDIQNNDNLFPSTCDALTQAGVIAQLPANTWGGSFSCSMEEIVGTQNDTIHQVAKLTVTDVPEDMAEYLRAQLPLTSCVGSTCISTILPPNAQVVAGCTDDAACNYNPVATMDDDSCYSASAGCSCADGADTQLDACGVCDGPGFGANGCCPGVAVDLCGECGGDDSVCADDCGVPNGDNSTCADDCGVANGDNSTCVDDCGVANGNNSTCLDCDGEPNGGASVDNCGECVGGGTGEAACQQDVCGDWGGDAQSCDDCGSIAERAACYGCGAEYACCIDGTHTGNVDCWSGEYSTPNGNFCGEISWQVDVNGGCGQIIQQDVEPSPR